MFSESFMNHVFNNSTMTMAINKTANQFGLMEQLGIAPFKGINSTVAILKYKDGQISVLPSKARGGPRTERNTTDEKSVFIEIPHFPTGGLLTPQDIQNRFAFTDDSFTPENAAAAQADLVEELRLDQDITLEYIRMGMAFGQIKDGDGNLLLDLHAAFGVPQTTINFELTTSTTNVLEKCRLVSRHFRKNARGLLVAGKPVIPCSTSFFDALIKHPNVEKFYLNFKDASQYRQNPATVDASYGERFDFGDCIFQSYDAAVPLADGTSADMIEDGKAVALPVNTPRLFQTFGAPANRMSTANKAPTEADRIYVSTKVLDHDKGVDIDVESNAIAVCTRPDMVPVLVAS